MATLIITDWLWKTYILYNVSQYHCKYGVGGEFPLYRGLVHQAKVKQGTKVTLHDILKLLHFIKKMYIKIIVILNASTHLIYQDQQCVF